jgi:hypothetical protein
MVPPLLAMTNTTLITIAHTTLLFRLPRHYQAFTTQKTIRPVKTNSVPFTLEQVRDAAIAESRMLTKQFPHPC